QAGRSASYSCALRSSSACPPVALGCSFVVVLLLCLAGDAAALAALCLYPAFALRTAPSSGVANSPERGGCRGRVVQLRRRRLAGIALTGGRRRLGLRQSSVDAGVIDVKARVGVPTAERLGGSYEGVATVGRGVEEVGALLVLAAREQVDFFCVGVV